MKIFGFHIVRANLGDILQLRGDIHVRKFRLEDPRDPVQRALALSVMPDDDHHGLYLPDGEAEGSNLFLNLGINRLWDTFTGNSSAFFNNADATIGIGDSNTAASAGQTDLQAASNKTYKAMDATFPTAAASQATTWRSTFTTSDANYAWQEFVIRKATGTLCLDRGVSSMGTKTAAGVWVPTVTTTIA